MKISNLYKRQTFIIVGIICVLLIVFVSISYAYFNSVLKSDNNLVIKSGDLEVSYTGSDIITGDFVPMDNSDGMETDGYSFTISNTGTLTTAYTIEIYADTSVSGTPIPHQYIMVSLNDETPKQLSTVTKTITGGTEVGNAYLLGMGTVVRSKSSTNTIKLWLKDDAPTSVIDNKVAFKIKVTNEVFKGELTGQEPYTCIRATTLHTETCSRDDSAGCIASGYTKNATITYGNSTITNGTLAAGDAFTCDVNGDGKYDEETERFYYVSSINDNSVSLIFYKNYEIDRPSNAVAQFNTLLTSYAGPINAIRLLPNINVWKNVTLNEVTRNIKDSNGTVRVNSFAYNVNDVNLAARLLTMDEVKTVCNSDQVNDEGYLNNCQFLMENTSFSSNNTNSGYWLENVNATDVRGAWGLYTELVNLRSIGKENGGVFGVRPVIEVLKTNIQY